MLQSNFASVVVVQAFSRCHNLCQGQQHRNLSFPFLILALHRGVVMCLHCHSLHMKTASLAMHVAGQSKGCLLEPLTSKNSWLEVHVKRRGQDAQWERLDTASLPEAMLSAFVQETRRTRAIPIPGQSLGLTSKLLSHIGLCLKE